MESTLHRDQETLDKLFCITPETRRRLDEGNVPESELKSVYRLVYKESPHAFFGSMSVIIGGFVALGGLGLFGALFVLGFSRLMFIQQKPGALLLLAIGGFIAVLVLCVTVPLVFRMVKDYFTLRSVMRAGARLTLQIIDADVSTFRYWQSFHGAFKLMSDLVLNSVERAIPGDATAVVDGRTTLPMPLSPLIIEGPVRIYLVGGVFKQKPLAGFIVGITLRPGAIVVEKEANIPPQINDEDYRQKIPADE